MLEIKDGHSWKYKRRVEEVEIDLARPELALISLNVLNKTKSSAYDDKSSGEVKNAEIRSPVDIPPKLIIHMLVHGSTALLGIESTHEASVRLFLIRKL